MKSNQLYRAKIWRLLLISLIGSAALASSLLLLVTSAWLISAASQRPPILELEVSIVLVRLFGISRGAIRYAARIMEHDQIFAITSELRVKIYHSLAAKTNISRLQLSSSKYLANITQAIDYLNDSWLRIILPILNIFFLGGVTWLFYLFFNARILLIIIPISLAIFLRLVARIRIHRKDISIDQSLFKNKADLAGEIEETLRGIPEANIFGFVELNLQKLAGLQNSLLDLEDRRAAKENRWQLSTNFAFLILFIPILYFTLSQFHSNNLTGLLLGSFLLAPFSLFEPAYLLPPALALDQEGKAAEILLDEVLVNSEIELTDSFRRDELSFAINSLTLIDFAAIRNNAELMKINIHLNKGDVKQISGRSGFGKSSILEGMIGNLPTVGSYLINSSDFEVKQLSEYSILLQNDHLFITSIRENFKIAKPEITDEEIWHLLSLVEMDHVISKFTEELDLIIGNTNIPLSGGEIQRIKWARSLARKRQVYIWDEPCEYLDAALIARTLPKVIDEVMGEAKEAIVLIISHIDLISYLNIPV